MEMYETVVARFVVTIVCYRCLFGYWSLKRQFPERICRGIKPGSMLVHMSIRMERYLD